jgi:predicted RNA-binding protein YlxR (DUF448 family)
MRQCSACRGHFEKRQLLRVVRTPEGTVTVDTVGKVNGRGVYICKNEACLEKAVKSKALSRALEVPVSDDVIELIRQTIKEQADG